MKRNYMIRFVLLLLAVISGQSMKAQTFSGGTGTETDPYQIASLDDWNTLAYAIVGNSDQAAFAGKFFKMTANIGTTENPVTIPLGKQTGSGHNTRKRFAGIFDGDGHTLTVNINNKDINNKDNPWFENNASYCAPFAYAQNITIRNLTVLGTITTTGQFASGLVGQSGPDNQSSLGTCTIENCHVGATFVGNTGSGNGNHGIFISVAEGNASITNSWFDGEIAGSNYYYSGGFIGLNKATATLTDCLFNPASIASTVNYKQSSEFSHDIGGTSKLTRCYYTKSFSDPETAQGQRVRTGAAPEANDYYSVYTNDIKDENEIPRPTPDGYNYYIIMENYIWTRIQSAMGLNSGVTSYSFEDIADERLIEGKLVAGKDNTAFVVPEGKTFTLDLNGKTIDRELDVVNPALTNGYIIKVAAGAKLTVTNGTIQHGHNNSDGGCIYNEGELILDGVTITKNYADGNGSGAGIYNAGTLSLNNVTIKDNHLKSDGTGTGAGIYNTGDATLHISGKVLITGNKKGTQENNLFLAGSSVITVDAAIKGTSIGVMKETNGVFTKGLKNKGNASNFKSNANNIFVALYSEGANEGEAYLYGLETIDLYNNPTDVTNASVITPYNGLHVNVKLNNRTLYKDGYWNTICLPFKTSKSGPLKDAEVRKLKSATIDEAGILNITFEAVSTLNAGTPYLIRWNKPEGYDQNPDNFDVKNPTFSNVVIESTTPGSVTTDAITFLGIYDPTPLSNDRSILVMGAENTLTYPTNANYKLRAFRGYFEVNGAGSEIKAFEMNFEDDPTSIQTIYSVQSPMNDAIYNLAGQRMGKMQRGINIVNGKKIFIK